jgi:hypothetical protein
VTVQLRTKLLDDGNGLIERALGLRQ